MTASSANTARRDPPVEYSTPLAIDRRALVEVLRDRPEAVRLEPPGNFQLVEVVRVDLVERRIARVTDVPAVGGPLAAFRTVLRGPRPADRKENQSHGDTSSTTKCASHACPPISEFRPRPEFTIDKPACNFQFLGLTVTAIVLRKVTESARREIRRACPVGQTVIDGGFRSCPPECWHSCTTRLLTRDTVRTVASEVDNRVVPLHAGDGRLLESQPC